MRALLAALPDEDLELIILTPEEFKRARVEEHEIKVDGHMFDIARVVEKDSTLYVYGVYDRDEDNLIVFLDAVLNKAQADTRSLPQVIIKFITLIFIIPDSDFTIGSTLISTAITTHCIVPYESLRSLISPPPKARLAYL